MEESFDRTNAILKFLTCGYCSKGNESCAACGCPTLADMPESLKARVAEQIVGLGVERRLASIRGIHATLLPVLTVGVQGDGRSYSYLAGLSGCDNWSDLFFLANLIPKVCHNVNRVVYLFGPVVESPVTTITPTHLSEDVVRQLQEADDCVNSILLKHSLIRKLSQVPVVLFPVNFGAKGARSVAIRTFISNDFMTGVPAIPNVDIDVEYVKEMVAAVQKVPGIARVAYDLTSKPPGTTEWE